MQTKKYASKDVNSALKLIREDLGPDAIIIETNKTKTGVEVIAANQEESISPTLQNPGISQEGRSQEWFNLQSEIKSLKGLLEEQLTQLVWNDIEKHSSEGATLLKCLTQLGISESLCCDIINHIKLNNEKNIDQLINDALLYLSKILPISEYDPVISGGIYNFVGKTGVGKTTAVAKIAAQFSLQNERANVAIINADAIRIGAYDQIKNLGRLLNVEVYNAYQPKELAELVTSLSTKDLVLIDSPGVSNMTDVFSFPSYLPSAIGLKTIMVLSATLQAKVIQQSLADFVDIDGAILTKLDESSEIGSALSQLIEMSIPLVYVTSGIKIPDDLSRPKPMSLMAILMERINENTMGGSPLTHSFKNMTANVRS